MRERERERQGHRQREKQAPCREPDVGLDPGSPGSRLRLQVVPNLCTTGAALEGCFIYFIYLFIFLRFYLFIDTEREREAGTQAEGEAGSMQGA